MQRRQFLNLLSASTLAGLCLPLTGFRYWPEDGIWNPCESLKEFPPEVNELVELCWQGIDASQYRDCHVHLIGLGHNQSGIWINPKMQSFWHFLQNAQLRFYMNAACAEQENNVDNAFVKRLYELASQFPTGAKFMLVAFDYQYDQRGQKVLEASPFHTPNDYAYKIAQQHADRFEWIASVHPYRVDAIDELKRVIQLGARAIKWLPQAMGIDPSSSKCDEFYKVLVETKTPLLCHTGSEHAVEAGDFQVFGNPLRLRRALDQGVKVIAAHCASVGTSLDIDNPASDEKVQSIELFARLLKEPQYRDLLYGDISAITQINRRQYNFEKIYTSSDWHDRLIQGSDYPLPGVMPIFSLSDFVNKSYLSQAHADVLSQVRKYNPLLFDFMLKRIIRVNNKALSHKVFEGNRVFG